MYLHCPTPIASQVVRLRNGARSQWNQRRFLVTWLIQRQRGNCLHSTTTDLIPLRSGPSLTVLPGCASVEDRCSVGPYRLKLLHSFADSYHSQPCALGQFLCECGELRRH